ncbi:UNVERIFIED_CONTAM: Protein Asterix [Trichonephila clavipes]
MNVLSMFCSMFGLMMKLKWCAWVALYCSSISFANSRVNDDTKQILSSFMITIHRSAVSTFHDPGFFRHPLSSLPFRPFSPPSLPDPFLYIVSRSTCCQVQAAVPYTYYSTFETVT